MRSLSAGGDTGLFSKSRRQPKRDLDVAPIAVGLRDEELQVEDVAAAAECMHTTGAKTLEGLLSVLDGWREAALAEPAPARATGLGHGRGHPAGA